MEKKKLTHEQISLLTPESWISGNSIIPIIAYSSAACASLVKMAKDYLLSNEIVEDHETLDALGNSVTIDNWNNIFISSTAWCEERKLRLVDNDPRWGMSAADATENKRVVQVRK